MEPGNPIRQNVLETATALTTGDRNASYGDPTDYFQRIAAIYNASKQDDRPSINEHDVALFMVAVKLARLAHSPGHYDSAVDLAAYVAIQQEVFQKGV